ncbi:hypothetical protein [Nocardia abscessus]|uniref:hypothetical protein n=1 Tax=Nocardia abscessus TaxID=120957 RepID=UPI0024562AE7|nr:hypothetical protein [Nocardia abscessus]
MDGGDPAGGSAELARLIDKYGETLVPDLKRFYNVDIRDVFIEGTGVTPRFLLSLIIHLPAESATVAEQRGGQQFLGWTEDRYLAAGIYNAIRELTWAFIAANSKKKPKPPDALPLPSKEGKPKQEHKPGSFAFIALSHINRAKQRKE